MAYNRVCDAENPVVGHISANSNPENEVVKKEQAELIFRAMNECLSEVERFVLMNRFGFTEKVMTHPEIAKTLGITVNDSKAAQQRALNKLRKSFLNEMYSDAYSSKTWLSETVEFFPDAVEDDDDVVFEGAVPAVTDDETVSNAG